MQRRRRRDDHRVDIAPSEQRVDRVHHRRAAEGGPVGRRPVGVEHRHEPCVVDGPGEVTRVERADAARSDHAEAERRGHRYDTCFVFRSAS